MSEQIIGSKAQVWHETAKKTSGGLIKKDLMKNKHGRIVSKKKYFLGKKSLKYLKKMGYDLWFVIPLVFDTIFEKYELEGLIESEVIGKEKIFFQKMNNNIGLMCYLLTNNSYISNINIFKQFND